MCGGEFENSKDVCVDEACEMAFFCAYRQVVKLWNGIKQSRFSDTYVIGEFIWTTAEPIRKVLIHSGCVKCIAFYKFIFPLPFIKDELIKRMNECWRDNVGLLDWLL